jgi:hypothetical protein
MPNTDHNRENFSPTALTADEVRALLQHPQFEALASEAKDNLEMEEVVDFGIHLLAEARMLAGER